MSDNVTTITNVTTFGDVLKDVFLMDSPGVIAAMLFFVLLLYSEEHRWR